MPLTPNGIYYASTEAPLSVPDVISAMATSVSGSGGIVQIVTAQQPTQITTDSTTNYDFSGLQASITPVSKDSQIIVLANLAFSALMNSDGTGSDFILTRDGVTLTRVQRYIKNVLRLDLFSGYSGVAAINFLDEPNTLSNVTYSISGRVPNGIFGALIMNNIPSTITLLEIQQ